MEEILKWVAIVFIAGFIGYFGKYLGKIVIATLRRKSEEETMEFSSGKESWKEKKYEYKTEKERLKLEKERLKLEKKKAKEGSKNRTTKS